MGLTAALSASASAAPTIQLNAPQPFGYSIGDTIRHTLTLEPEPGQRLDESSLPKPGPLNRWLELRRISVEPGPGHSQRIHLEYQTFYAPLAVKPLTIPGLKLRWVGPGGAVTADSPAWSFSMTPLHGLAVLNPDGQATLRPDAWPEPPDTAAPLVGLAGFGLVALGAGLAFGYGRGWFDFGWRGRYFREANQELRRLATLPDEPAALRAGFACLHRAFDATFGEPVFAERLPECLAGRAGYEGLEREIEAFFAASYDLFFRDEGTADRPDALKNPLPLGRAQRGGRSRRVRGDQKDFFPEKFKADLGDTVGKSHLNPPHPNPPSTSLRAGLPEGEGAFSLARLETLCLACLRVERSLPL